jgi:hypothetical protein
MNKKRVHDFVAPIGICKQACDSSFRFHYITRYTRMDKMSSSESKKTIDISAYIYYHNQKLIITMTERVSIWKKHSEPGIV